MTDWEAVKTEYVTTDIGVRDLAKAHGVSKTAVANHCKAEEWVKLRDVYRVRVAARAHSRTESADVKSLTDRLLAVKQGADKASDIIVQRLDTLGTDGTAQDIRALTAALKDLAAVIRNVYDIPTLQEREAMRLAGERLRMEQRKADTDSKKEVVVTFEGEAGAWSE